MKSLAARNSEWVRSDGFVDTYIGKVYGDGAKATEVNSMSVEMCLPARMAACAARKLTTSIATSSLAFWPLSGEGTVLMAHGTVEHIDVKAQAGWDDQQGVWGDDTFVAHADAVWRYGVPVRRAGAGSVTPTPQTPQAAVLALLKACGGRGRVLDCDIPD